MLQTTCLTGGDDQKLRYDLEWPKFLLVKLKSEGLNSFSSTEHLVPFHKVLLDICLVIMLSQLLQQYNYPEDLVWMKDNAK